MSIAIETVRREALTLPPADRAALADELLASLDQPDPSIDAQWVEESARRFADYKSGRIGEIDAKDVFEELERS